MNLQLVETPPHFHPRCIVDGRTLDTSQEPVYADLEGEPWKGYYCAEHGRSQHATGAILASLALAPRDEHGEVIGEGW